MAYRCKRFHQLCGLFHSRLCVHKRHEAVGRAIVFLWLPGRWRTTENDRLPPRSLISRHDHIPGNRDRRTQSSVGRFLLQSGREVEQVQVVILRVDRMPDEFGAGDRYLIDIGGHDSELIGKKIPS